MAKTFRLDAIKPHPLLGSPPLMPALSDAEYAALKASIAEFGVRVPIIVAMPEGLILDGHHRYRAASELKHVEIPGTPEEFLSSERQIELGVDINASRRQWVNVETRMASAEALLKDDPSRSDRVVARLAKLSPSTVGKVRKDAEESGDVSMVDTRKDSTGRRQPSHRNGIVKKDKAPAAPKVESAEEIAAALARRPAPALPSKLPTPAVTEPAVKESAPKLTSAIKTEASGAERSPGDVGSTRTESNPHPTQQAGHGEPAPAITRAVVLKVRDAVLAAGGLPQVTPETTAGLTAADREWFQSLSRFAQLVAARCPQAKSEAA